MSAVTWDITLSPRRCPDLAVSPRTTWEEVLQAVGVSLRSDSSIRQISWIFHAKDGRRYDWKMGPSQRQAFVAETLREMQLPWADYEVYAHVYKVDKTTHFLQTGRW